MSESKSDRRSASRISYYCDVECVDFGLGRLRTSDLSKHGAFIDTICSVRVGSILQLRFKLHDAELQVKAEVRHCVPPMGIGVAFLDLSAADEKFISLILAEQVGLQALSQPAFTSQPRTS